MTTIRLVIVVFAVFVSACASASEPTSPSSPVVVDAPAPPSGGDVPRHTLAGEQSPGDKFGAMPSWPVDPDMCANARFTRGAPETGGHAYVTDSTTGLTWGAGEAIAFTPATMPDPVGFANGLCNAEYPGTRAATKAEIDIIAKAVPNCPLPGAFYSTDLWNAMTGDAKCIDLKKDAEVSDGAPTPAPLAIGKCSALYQSPSQPVDVARIALCVK